MPTEPRTITLAQAVHKAVEVCEDSTSEGLVEMLDHFQDADEPITAIPDVPQRLDEKLGPIEFDEPDGALSMARAVVTYLAFRRDEIDEDPVALLRLAARAEFDGGPPDYVARWLSDQDITV
jgi:hypothetical protein